MWEEPRVYPFRREAPPLRRSSGKRILWRWPVWNARMLLSINGLADGIRSMAGKSEYITKAPLRLGEAAVQGIASASRFLFDPIGWLWLISFIVLVQGTLLGGLMVVAPAALTVAAFRKPHRLIWSLAGAFFGWAFMFIEMGNSFAFRPTATGFSPVADILIWSLLATVSFLIGTRTRWDSRWMPPLVAFILWILGFAALAGSTGWQNIVFYNGVLLGFQGLFAAVLTVAFLSADEALFSASSKPWTREEQASLLALTMCFLLGLPQSPIGGINLSNVFIQTGILIGALLAGPGGGAVFGIALGLLPALSTSDLPENLAMFALSGLLGGLMRNWGKPGILAGFFTGHLLMSAYVATTPTLDRLWLETLTAGGLFLLWPKTWHKLISRKLAFRAEVAEEEAHREKVAGQLTNMGRLFQDLAGTFETFSKNKRETKEDWDPLFQAISERVCRPCSSFGLCWERDFHRTYQYLGELITQVEEKGSVTAKDLTPQLARRCTRLGEVSNTIACLLETVEVDRYWRRQMQENRGLLAAQFRGLGDWLNSLARDMGVGSLPQNAYNRLNKALRSRGFKLQKIKVRGSGEEDWRLVVQGNGCQGEWPCAEEAAPAAGQILGKPLVVGRSRCSQGKGRQCIFTLAPIRPYKISVGTAQKARNKGAVSGDNTCHWTAPGPKAIVAISDGAGVGERAAKESQAALDLLKHLSRAGVAEDTGIKSVNSLLALAADGDTFATIDMVVFDMVHAEAEFVKLGAPPSFIKRQDHVRIVQTSSLPVGIVNSLEVESVSVALSPGDLLVLISDGIFDHGKRDSDWLAGFLQDLPPADPQSLADLILKEAMQGASGDPRDDMTVVVVEILNREELKREA